MGRRRYQKPDVYRSESRKNPRWYFDAYIDAIGNNGQIKRPEKRFWIGECSVFGKREAEKIRDQILAEVINKPAFAIQSQIPFGRVLDEFIEVVSPQVRDQTARHYASGIECHIRPAFGHLRMCDMTNQACQRWLNSLAKEHAGPERKKNGVITTTTPGIGRSSRKQMLILFRHVWARATDWNYTRELCPLRRASLGPIEARRQKTLPTVDQFRAMVQILREPYRSMLLVATFTGMRISEILGLQRGDIVDGFATIRRSRDQRNLINEVKSEASWRVLPVAHLSGALSVRGAATDFIFDRTYHAAQENLRKAAKVVGIEYEGFGWHTFRRASVTWGKRAGASQADSKAQHGHSDDATNDLYYVQDDADLKRRAAQESAMFDAVMFGQAQNGKEVM